MQQFLRHLLAAAARTKANWSVALAVILTLGFGVGANTAMFSVVHAVIFSPLSGLNAERLMVLWRTNSTAGAQTIQFSPADFQDFQRSADAFEGLAALRETTAALTGVSQPRQLSCVQTTADFFSVSGLQPALGRTFAAGEIDVVILGRRTWTEMGADPGILGRTLTLDGRSHEVIGVMPPGLQFPRIEVSFWTPLRSDPSFWSHRQGGSLLVVGRLRVGASVNQANQELARIAADLAEAHPVEDGQLSARAVFLRDHVLGEYPGLIVQLQGIVALGLLLALANLTQLNLAQAAARARETAVRRALGGTWRHLWTEISSEALLVAFAGCFLALILARLGLGTVVGLLPPDFPQLEHLSLNWTVLVLSILACLGLTMLAGLCALALASGAEPSNLLNGRWGWGGPSLKRIFGVLVAGETAVALVVVIGAGLLMKSLDEIREIDLGFEPDGLTVAGIWLPEGPYSSFPAQQQFWRALEKHLETAPGIAAVSAASAMPLLNPPLLQGVALGNADLTDPSLPTAAVLSVSPAHFDALDAELVLGRALNESDHDGAPGAAVVNQSFIDQFLPGEPPLGRTLRLYQIEARIVGVVRDIRSAGFFRQSSPEIYLSNRQESTLTPHFLAVRSSLSAARVREEIFAAVRNLDHDLAVQFVQPMERYLDRRLASRWLAFYLLLVLATAASGLAVAGAAAFGAMSIRLLRKPLAVRSSLGAGPARLVMSTLSVSLRWVGVGLAVGAAAAAGVSRFLESFLYQVKPIDFGTFLAAAVLVAACALAAAWWPARRAARLNVWEILKV